VEANFGRSTLFSLGVEEEFQIVDAGSLALLPVSEEILSALRPRERTEHMTFELFQSTVETTTGIAGSVAEAVDELAALRRRLREIAAEQGALVASSGTHPFTHYEDQEITDRPRYRNILEDLRWVAERGLVFGLHVHVGIDTAARAIACADALRTYLPELLALSANSPFWHGRATGLASTRAKVFEGFPRSGIPPAFGTFAEFEHLVERGIRTGSFPDYTYMWWDVRPHPKLGTIEMRICDAQTRLGTVAAIVALTQSLVATLADDYERDGRLPVEPVTLLEENKWRATRDGLDAELIDLSDDTQRPAREAIRKLVERCAPAARTLGCEEELAGVETILAGGGGAGEQRDVFAETGSLRGVVRRLVEITGETRSA
jgi:carboxylate-amine ligase